MLSYLDEINIKVIFSYKITIKDMERECENESGKEHENESRKGVIVFKNVKDKIVTE